MCNYEAEAAEEGFRFIIGIDEAGRGPLAGPVVAAAVALQKKHFSHTIKDSKQLCARDRQAAFHEIWDNAYVGVGIISESVIDQADILKATFWAMANAVEQLIFRLPCAERQKTEFNRGVCLLIDGNQFQSDLPYSVKTIVKGDERVLSIACASIIAKVIRDRILQIYHRIFPEYGFDRHKGYPTRDHCQAIRRLGPCLIHRKTFHCPL